MAKSLGRPDVLLRPEEVRQQYSSALGTLFERVRTQAVSGDMATEWLKALAAFYEGHVRWAVLSPSGTVQSMESGQQVLAWFVAISPNHPRARQQRQVLQTDWMNSHYGLFVRPERVTHEWAAILATHELEHLASMASGLETRHQSRDPYLDGEVRAYSVEGVAADVLCEGRYLKALEKVIEENGFTTTDAIAKLNGSRELDGITRRLDGIITAHQAASAGESRLRGGLHIMALAFVLINQQFADWDRRLEGRKRYIEQLYEPLGVLPPR